MKNCIIVIGYPGSGKTKTSKKLSETLQYRFIEVSDVVRILTGRKRDTIRFNKLTGEVVAKELIKNMNKNYDYVISGIRQEDIINELKKYYNLYIIKLDLPRKLRYKRVNMRERVTYRQLQESDNLDSKLGLKEVMKLKGFTIKEDSSPNKNIELILNYLKVKQ